MINIYITFTAILIDALIFKFLQNTVLFPLYYCVKWCSHFNLSSKIVPFLSKNQSWYLYGFLSVHIILFKNNTLCKFLWIKYTNYYLFILYCLVFLCCTYFFILLYLIFRRAVNTDTILTCIALGYVTVLLLCNWSALFHNKGVQVQLTFWGLGNFLTIKKPNIILRKKQQMSLPLTSPFMSMYFVFIPWKLK